MNSQHLNAKRASSIDISHYEASIIHFTIQNKLLSPLSIEFLNLLTLLNATLYKKDSKAVHDGDSKTMAPKRKPTEKMTKPVI